MNEHHRRHRLSISTQENQPFNDFLFIKNIKLSCHHRDDARVTFTNENKRKETALTWGIMDQSLKGRREKKKKTGLERCFLKRRNTFSMLAMLTNSSQVSSRKPLFCRPLKFLSQIAGRAAISVISLSTSKLAKAANELIFSFILCAPSFSSQILILHLIS